MEKEKSKTGVIVAMHILAWALLGFVLLFYQPLSWGVRLPPAFWIKQCLNFGLIAGLFYFNAHFIVPNYLLKNKVVAFVICIISLVIALLIISKFADNVLRIHEQMEIVMPRPGPRRKGFIDVILLLTTLLVLGVSTTLTVIQRWQTDAQIRNSVEKQNITSELALLKAQINPHFFFNTLNNIYALTFTDVPVSRDAILKLSRMMRYLLYDTQHDTSLLSQEVSFIKDFVELMKLRMQNGTNIIFPEPKSDKEYCIAPMLLLPFIENAFKHGIDASQKAEIKINLNVSQGFLTLKIENQVFKNKNALSMESGGIGLANTQRRLDLLYAEKHDLIIKEDKAENSYQITLIINLL